MEEMLANPLLTPLN